jgi:hypothetical protein
MDGGRENCQVNPRTLAAQLIKVTKKEKLAVALRQSYGEQVGVRRFELPTPTSLTWCANRAALHPEFPAKFH